MRRIFKSIRCGLAWLVSAGEDSPMLDFALVNCPGVSLPKWQEAVAKNDARISPADMISTDTLAEKAKPGWESASNLSP
jgi:hypothetical protein